MADSIKIKIDGDDSGFKKSLSGLGGVAKKGLGVALKGIAAGAAAGTAALVAMGTQAVKSYADYEQLVGGVETLFKDSADTVKAYADRAYQTAGISANKYMETVTSFSASLLQSLGGDTKAAADMSDMALTDMSDNANKMGTDMEMIIQTYQSLSKGNFAMLDNLKLGYGGTKSEMQRLIKEASKLDKSVKANDMSFGNMVKAIHAVQTEMGITGTTAKEAATTISGSASAMKAAWQNLLTGMADPTQDFDALIQNFISSVGTFASNLMPVVQNTIQGVLSAIQQLLPQAVSGISQMLPQVMQTLVELINQIAQSLPGMIQTIVSALPQVVQTIAQALPTLIPALIDGISQSILIIAQSLPSIIGPIIQSLPEIVSAIADGIISNIPVLIEAGAELAVGLVEGMFKAIPALLGSVGEVFGFVGDLVNGASTAFRGNSKAVNENDLEYQALKKSIEDGAIAYDKLKQAQMEKASADLAEVARTETLFQELQRITDSNGKVTAGYEKRANFILGQLNSAYGTEYTMIDGVIQKYGELQGEIESLIEKKKWQIVQEAALPAYEEAYNKQIEKRIESEKALQTYNQKNLEYQEQLQQFQKEYADSNENVTVAEKWKPMLEEARQAAEDARVTWQSSQNELQVLSQDINDYESAMAMAAEGNYEGAMARLSLYTSAYNESMQKAAGNIAEQRQITETEFSASQGMIETYLNNVRSGTETFNEGILRQLVSHATLVGEKGQELGAALGDGTITGLDGAKVSLLGGAEEAANALIAGLSGQIIDGKPEVTSASEEVAQGAKEGLETDTAPQGQEFTEEYAGGIRSGTPQAESAASGVAQNSKANLNTDTTPEGVGFTSDFAGGISSQTGTATSAAAGVAQNSKASLNTNTAPEGVNFSTQYAGGISSQTGAVSSAASGVVQSAASGFSEGQDTNNIGSTFANGFVTGISSQSGAASSAGANIAKSAVSGTKTVTAFASGSFFGQGYVIGINSQASAAYQAGYNLGKQAAQGTKDAQQEGSPSKLMKKSGVFFSQGFVIGIRSGAKDVKKAGGYIAKTAIDSVEKPLKIHSPSVYARDDIGKMFTKGIAIGIKAGKYEVSEATQLLFDELQLQRDLDAISEEEYYKQLEFLRDEYITQGTKEWWDYTKELVNHAKEIREELGNEMLETFETFTGRISEAYEALSDVVTDKLDEVMDKQKDFADSLRDASGGLVQEVTKLDAWGNEMPGFELTDYRKKAAYIEAYGNTLENTSKRLKDAFGEDVAGYTEFMQQIRDDGEDGLHAAYLLQQMSDEDLRDYIQGYQHYNSVIDNEAQSQYADEVGAVKRMWEAGTKGLSEEFLKEFGELPEGFFDLGAESGKNFGEAFEEEFQTILDDVLLSINSSMGSFNLKFAEAGNPNTTSVSYQPSYYILPSRGESTHSQLMSIRDNETLNRMRGGY